MKKKTCKLCHLSNIWIVLLSHVQSQRVITKNAYTEFRRHTMHHMVCICIHKCIYMLSIVSFSIKRFHLPLMILSNSFCSHCMKSVQIRFSCSIFGRFSRSGTNMALSADFLISTEDILNEKPGEKIIFHRVMVNKNNCLYGTQNC